MRTRTTVVAVFLFVVVGLFFLGAPRPAQGAVSVSVSFFHEQLSPHGRWIVAGSYGDVWVPGSVRAGWAPYVDGEWIWTDYGWTWVSDDPWGDVPYHYGSWVFADSYGWCWVPGTVWAPAWVTWAYTDDYIGWAPVPPTFVLTSGGYFGGPIVISQSRYCFVPTSRFVGVNVATARVPAQQNPTIFTRATKATSFSVSGGIVHTAGLPLSRIEKVTGRHLERASIDRLKARPTTIAAGGLGKARTLHVAVPAKERARELRVAQHPASAHPESGKQAHVSSAKGTHSPKTATTHEKTRVAGKPEAKAASGHRTVSAERSAKTSTSPVKHEKTRVTAKQEPKTKSSGPHASSTSATGHTNTSASRTTEARRHDTTPQSKPKVNVAEKPHREARVQSSESHGAVNRVEKSTPPKERAAVGQTQTVHQSQTVRQPQSATAHEQVANNRTSHKESVAAAPPARVKDSPPPRPYERPKEEKPKGSE